MWNAKYTIWIPEDSAHALVYMADEAKHGLPFPKDIQEVVQKLLKKRWWLGA